MAQLATPALVDGSNSGSNSDNISNFTAPEFDIDVFNAVAGDVIELYMNGNPTGVPYTVTGAESGPIQLTASAITAGDNNYNFTVEVTTQGAGSSTTSSLALTYTLDTAAPTTAPTMTFVDSGTTGDATTNDATVAITNVDSGGSWEYKIGTGSWTTGTSTSFAFDGGAGDGTYDVEVRQIDAAGNIGPSSGVTTYTLDGTAPTTAPTMTFVDSGTTGDATTNDATVAITNVDSGGSWEYKIGTGSWTTGTSTSFAFDGGAGDGTYDVEVRQIDAAGNIGPSSGVTTYTLDGTAPTTAPTMTFVDSGTTGDATTNDATVAITNVDSGGSWEYKIGTGSWTTGTSTSFAFDGGAGDGTYDVEVRQIDAAGNIGPSSGVTTYTLDTSADAYGTALAVAFSGFGTDTTFNGNEAITVDLSGLDSDAIADVTVTSSGGGSVDFSGVASNGSLTLNSAQMGLLSDGNLTISATATDNAGNTSAPVTTNSYALETSKPTISSATITGENGADGVISDADDDNSVVLEIEFSEAMDTTAASAVTVSLDTAAAVQLTETVRAWDADGKTLKVTYTVADNNVDLSGITVNVSGAKDAFGNVMTDVISQSTGTSLDTLNPVDGGGSKTIDENPDGLSASSGSANNTILNTFDITDGTTYVFATGGNPGSAFAIDAATGELTIADETHLDLEDNGASYAISLIATDNAGNTTPVTYTVNLSDVNDAPILSTGGTPDVAGTVTENGDGTDGTYSTSGDISFHDDDLADVHSINNNPVGTGYIGAFLAGIGDQATGDGEGEVNWSFNITDAAQIASIEALGEGETIVQTYQITVSDSATPPVTLMQTVTITIKGTNDAPVINGTTSDIAGAITEDQDVVETGSEDTQNVTGTIKFSDVDVNDTADTHSVAASSTTVASAKLDGVVFTGTVPGNLTFETLDDAADTVGWKYEVEDSALDFLADGKTLVLTYDVVIEDDSGTSSDASAAQTITITLTGTNDAPVVSTATGENEGAVTEAGNLDDGTVVAGTPSATGTLASTDVDDDSTATWAASTSNSTSSYGAFSVTSAGAWTYTLSMGSDALKEGETISETYDVIVTDDMDAKATETVTITINGTNDAPVVSTATGADEGAVTEAGNLDDGTVVAGTPSATGTLASTDVDDDSTATWEASTSNSTSTYGAFSVTSAGAWTYTLGAGSDALKEGETISETYDVIVTDDMDAKATETVTITINGTNDAPVVSTATGENEGAVTEAGNLDDGTVVAGTLSATGTLASTDVDDDSTATWEASDSNATSTYGAFSVTSAGAWTYTLGAGSDALKEGETISETYDVIVTDDMGAKATETVTITINGTNDAPVVSTATGADEGAVTEAGNLDDGTVVAGTPSATGTLASTDVDDDSSATWAASTSNATSSYGAFSVTSAGAWTYTLGAGSDALKEGETISETYDVIVTDDMDAKTTETVTITINGTNDAPVVSTATGENEGAVTEAGNLDDGTVVAGTPSATGTLASTDVDDDSTATWAASTSNSTSSYGAFSVTSAGAWTYTLSAGSDALKEGETISETYDVIVTDDMDAKATETVTITINGTNDAPVVSTATGADEGAVTEAGNLDDGTVVAGTLSATGTLASTDADDDSSATWEASTSNSTSTYGAFSVTSAGAWTYTLGAGSDALKEGETISETYDVIVTDDMGAKATETVTITINGTNDAPVVSTATGADEGAVTEAGNLDDGTVVAGTPSATGTLASTDVDDDSSATWAASTSNATSSYGAFSVTSAGAWTYTLGAGSDALKEDETISETYDVIVTDDMGAKATETVTITINGTNDAPVVAAALTKTDNDRNDDGAGGDEKQAINLLEGVTDADDDATHTAVDLSVTSSTARDMTGFDLTVGTGADNGILKFDADFFKDLDRGVTETITISYTIKDENGAEVAQTLAVTVTGTNHAPFVVGTAGTSGEVIEIADNNTSPAEGSTLTQTEDITFDDYELSDTHSVSITPSGADAASYLGNMAGGQITAASGAGNGTIRWTFSVDDADLDFLAVGEELTQTYTISILDNDSVDQKTATETLTITIKGSNDGPVITSSNTTKDFSEAAEGTAAPNFIESGTIAFNDVDETDIGHTSSTTIAATGVTGGFDASADTALAGYLTVDPVTKNLGDTTGSAGWTFNAPDSAFDYLAKDEVLTLTYTVSIEDNDAGGYYSNADQVIIIKITGTNDTPVVEAKTGNATEDGAVVDIALSVTDDDTTDTHTYQIASGLGAGNGSVTIDGSTAKFDPGSDFQDLREGDTRDVTFTYTATDDSGDTATNDSVAKTVTVTVTGTNDAPVITVTGTNSAAEGVIETNATGLTTNGTLSVADVDTMDVVTAAIDSVAVTGADGGITNAALKAMMSVNAAAAINNASTSGTITWAFDSDAEAFNHLADGETLVLDYTISATDNAATSAADTRVVSVTITGANDAPTISVETGDSASETIAETDGGLTSLGGTLSVEDLDITDTVSVAVSTVVESGDTSGIANATLLAMMGADTGNIIGGTATTGAVNWEFDSSGEAFDYLAVGETLTLTYTLTVSDDATTAGTATQDVVISITGTNDTPVVAAKTGAAIEDGAVVDIALSVTDDDTTDTHTYQIASGLGAGNGSVAIDGSTAKFNPGSDFQDLREGETRDVTFTYTATDDSGDMATNVSDAKTVTVTVTGTNDAPVITITGTDSAAEGVTETNAALTTNGTLSVADVDTKDVVTAAVDGVAVNAASTGADGGITNAALKAMMSVNAAAIDNASTSGTITWAFDSDAEAFNHLADGETLVLDYTISATDDATTPAADTQVVSVTITGANDAPTISVETGDSASETIAETDAGLTSLGGTLSVKDLDITDTVSVAVSTVVESGDTSGIANATLLAMMGADTGNIIGGSATTGAVNWEFDSSAEAFDYLAVGETLTLTYTLTVSDDATTAGTATQDVVISITGTNDAPVVSANTASTNDNAATFTFDLLTNATDVDTATLSIDGLSATVIPTGDVTDTLTLGTNYSITGSTLTVVPSFFDALDVGESSVIAFNYNVIDGKGGSTPNTLTVTVDGANDAPVAVTDTIAVTEGAFVTVNAVTGAGTGGADTDAEDHAISVTGISNVGGAVTPVGGVPGTITTAQGAEVTISSNGQLTYNATSNTAAFNALAAGATAVDTFEYTISDGNGGTDIGTINVTITGTNDAVVANADTITGAEDTVVSGSVVTNDTDVDTGDTKTVVGASAGVGTTVSAAAAGGFDIALADGVIVHLASDGSYTVDIPQSLSGSQVGTDAVSGSFSYTVQDGGGASSTAIANVTIAGANDAPVSSGPATGSVDEDDSTPTINLLQNVTDVDDGDTISIDGTVTQATGDRTITFDVNAAGELSFDPNQFNDLAEGESEVLTFNYNVTDGNSTPISHSAQVTVTGTNDAPVINGTTSDIAGAITEDQDVVETGSEDTQNVTGTIEFSDVDVNDTADTHSVAASSTTVASAKLDDVVFTGTVPGNLTFEILDNAADTVGWKYEVADSALDFLADGEELVLTYDVVIEDDSGTSSDASAAQTITITLTGTNDAPVVSTATGENEGAVTEAGNLDDGTVVAGTPSATGTLASTDVDDDSTATWAASTSNSTSSYGAFSVTSAGAWTYTLSMGSDALKEGETISETYDVIVTDDMDAKATETVTITINGTNDAPVVSTATGADEGAVTEAGNLDDGTVVAGTPSATGTLASTDVDDDSTATWEASTSNSTSTYGAFSVTSAGAWTYTLGAGSDALKEGETISETYDVIVTDDMDAKATETVTITINGTNDAPVVSTATGENEGAVTEAGNLDDGTVVAGTLSATGTLASTDVDDDSTATWEASDSNATSTYGAFSVTSAGAWTYTLGAGSDALKEGETISETYDVIVTDDMDAKATETVTITINGTNDAPVVSTATGADEGAVTEAGNLDDGTVVAGTPSATGTLASTDVDDDSTATWAASTSNSTSSYGAFSVTSAGAWTYTLSAGSDALKEGETISETYDVIVTDDMDAKATETVTITINGTNDAPVVSTATGADEGAVTEAGNLDDGTVVAGTPSATGTLASTDVDDDSTATWEASTSNSTSTYGAFSVTSAGAWTYTLGAGSDALKEGETISETYDVIVTDDMDAKTTETVTITINGTNDAPVVSTATGADEGAVTEAGNLDDGTVVAGTPSATGTLASTDVDDDSTATWAASTSNSTSSYGAFSVTSAGAWTYTLSAGSDALKEGETISETYDVIVTDDMDAKATETVTITINGTNDAPVVSTATGADEGAVTEAGNLDDGTVVAGTLSATGTLASTDADDDSTATWEASTSNSTSTYGAFTVTSAGVWTYTLSMGSDALKEDETISETYDVIVTDDKGAKATETVTITINGTNDAPVVSTATGENEGAVTEAGNLDDGTVVAGTPSATGTLASTDADDDSTATWEASDSNATSSYGAFSVTSAGAWTYTLGAGSDALKEGETISETYDVIVTDDMGAKATETVTITINGTNDAPVVAAKTGNATEDGAVVDIALSVTDADTTDTHSYQIASGPSAGNGSVTINGSTATFDPGLDFQDLGAGETRDVTFTYTATDNNSGVSSPATVTVTVTGTNDLPAVSAVSGTATEDGAVSNIAFSAVTDVDANDTHTYQIASQPSAGSISLGTDGKSADFNPGSDFQDLGAGETRDVTFTYTATDNKTGVSSPATVTVTVTGTNDLPVVSGAFAGAVTEGNPGDANVTATGTLSISDADANDTPSFADESGITKANGYGTFDIAGGNWTYTLDQSKVQDLDAGDEVNDTHTFTASDGTTQVVTVAISGSDDAAEITGTFTGSVTEGDLGDTETATGAIAVSDVDGDDTPSFANATATGTYGSIAVNAGGNQWTYTLDQAKAQGLSDGDAVADTVTLTDSKGNTQDIIVTVNGEDDVIIGDEFPNTLVGTDGSDVINGLESADHITGKDGDDRIQGGEGADVILGGAGNDTAVYSDSDARVKVNLDAGTASGGHATGDTLDSIENLKGSNFNDDLRGDDGANVLNGMDGNDYLLGGDGADENIGGNGTDWVSYYYSDAAVNVDLTTQTVSGGHADGDTISSIERITGSNLHGDVLKGDAGENLIRGYGGDDTIAGGDGADAIQGGAGNDTADYSDSNARVKVNLETGVTSGGHAAGDVLDSIENLKGSSFNDDLRGDDGANVLNGMDGNDYLHGGGGADEIIGGNGTDWVSYYYSDAAVNVDLTTQTVSGGHADGDTISSIERITGSNLHGDVLKGDAGENLIRGYGGDDTIAGGGGADAIQGGAGNDTADYSDSDARVKVNLETGVTSGGHAAGDVLDSIENLTGSDFNDDLRGDDGANVLTGSYGNDYLQGGDGADVISGGSGTDWVGYYYSDEAVTVDLSTQSVSGGHADGDTISSIERVTGSNQHDDVLTGNAGDNLIRGYGGEDTISGGAGDDVMRGGSGDDVFIFTDDFGVDVIEDFQVGIGEVLDLQGVTGITSYADLVDNHLGEDASGSATITDGTNVITLEGVDKDDLSSFDFVI